MRYHSLDSIRGMAIISMILYHFVWDLVYILGFDLPWFKSDLAYFWQQSICWVFILLSGFCWSLGKNRLKRGITVSLAGILISAVTIVFVPEDRIVFGVLTLIGASMLLLIPLEKIINKVNAMYGLIISIILFALTRNINRGYLGFERWNIVKLDEGLYQGSFMTFLGFMDNTFFSTDYFSLFPWFFLFLSGYFLYRIVIAEKKINDEILKRGKIRGLSFVGQKSLIFYLFHQPIIYALILAID